MHDRISVNALCFQGATPAQIVEEWRALDPRRVSISSDLVLGPDGEDVLRLFGGTGYAFETSTHLFLGPRPVSDRAAWAQARQRMDQAVAAMERLGGHSIYLLTGGHGDLVWEDAAACFAEAIAPCVPRARDAGIALLVETAQIFFADLHLAHSLRDTVTLAEIAGIGVCIDLFPCWPEAGLRETIVRAMPRLHLVQVGDYRMGDRAFPCRAAAGDGDIPIDRLLGWILDAGYRGAFDLELLGPRVDTRGHAASVRRTAAVIEAAIARHAA